MEPEGSGQSRVGLGEVGQKWLADLKEVMAFCQRRLSGRSASVSLSEMVVDLLACTRPQFGLHISFFTP